MSICPHGQHHQPAKAGGSKHRRRVDVAKVAILLNQDRDAGFGLTAQFDDDGKKIVPASHELRMVFEYETTGLTSYHDLRTCEWAFETFNIGFDPDMNRGMPQEQRDLAERYVMAVKTSGSRHTSLSVGDVVVIEDRPYSCEPVGFSPRTWAELKICTKGNG
jgi:hypothetical protein